MSWWTQRQRKRREGGDVTESEGDQHRNTAPSRGHRVGPASEGQGLIPRGRLLTKC